MQLIIIVLLLSLAVPLQASIASVEAEIAAINTQITSLTNDQITPLEAEITELRAGMEEARTYMNAFAARNDWLLTEYAAHRSRLRQYEGRALQLSMSYGDFFDAKNTWAASSDPAVRRAQIIIMFRYLNGNSREPGQWELDPNTQQDFVDMADLIVRRRAVARIGEALVLLGDLTLELVDAIKGIPQNLREAAFAAIDFAAKATSKLLPDDTVRALNETCLRYIPYLEFQKQRAELLAEELNAIRNRDEFGGENGRVEALAKTQSLVAFEQDVLAELEPEVTAYRSRKAEVEANFAILQEELNAKMQERETLRRTLHQYTQNRIDKEFELRGLQEQQAIDDNGGPINYVTNLTAGSSASTIAPDALSSALLNLPRYAVLSSNAGYITTQSAGCSYSETIGDQTYTYNETYHTKKTFSAPAAQPTWRKVDPTGDVAIVGNQAHGVAAGVVPLQAVLSPKFDSESYSPHQHCPSNYVPTGSGEKSSGTLTLNVEKVAETLFVPSYYYYKEYQSGMTAEAAFAAMKAAAETYGKGIDLFIGGKLQQTGNLALYYTVHYADGTTTLGALDTPQTRPAGDLASFEINNQMKVLGQGSANLWPILLDKDGVQVPAGSVNPLAVTGNKVEPAVAANGAAALTPADDVTLVINEPAPFSVSVKGPAEMTHYEVKWRYFIYKTTYPTGWQAFDRHNGAAVTPFSGASDNWVSVNPVTLAAPEDHNQKFKVEFDVVRKYDGVVVYSGIFDRIRSIVKGKSFFLAGRTTHEAYPGSNYFLFRGFNYLAPAIASQNLELRLDLGDGRSVVIPFTALVQDLLYGTDGAANQNLGTIKVYDNYMYTSFSSIDACGNIDLGLYELKEADLDSLLSQLGVVVERTANTVMTALDVNLFRVNYRETASGPMYLLKGCSPTSLHDFKARWTFFDDTTAESTFTTVGLLQESQTPMSKGLKQVELISPLGNTAAQVGFLSASGPNSVNKVSKEIAKYYTITSEYRYNETRQGYMGQLSRLTKNDMGGAFDQLELDFQFPDAFPQVLVKTVNDVNGAPLPVIQNVAIDAQGVAFDAVMPGAGYFTRLTVLQAPAFGTMAIDGIHVVYTPRAGFRKIDRFVIRLDGKICDILPDVIYFNLEGEVDWSGARPVVRFKQVFTPVYGYGVYALGFALMDGSGQDITANIAANPTKLIVEATASGAAIKMGTLYGNERDLFKLGLTIPGGVSGEATVNAWRYMAYPEFFTYTNQDYAIPPMLILHRFFESFENGPQQIKNIWAETSSGELLLNGAPLGYTNLVPAADLLNLVFRPKKDYTGPTALYFYGSADGVTWSSQMRIGGLVLAGDGKPGLADVIRLLQILSGVGLFLPEPSPIVDIHENGRIGLSEVIYILQQLAGLRP